MRVPIKPRTLEELRNITTPAPVVGGNMEVFRDPLYDTQSYPAAGIAQLNFFVNPNADQTLSNIEQGGTVPDPEYYQLWYARVTPIIPPTVAAAPTTWRDMQRLMTIGRPTLTLTIMSKPYGPWHVHEMGTSGPQYYGYSTQVAAAGGTSTEIANAGPDMAGFCFDGALWLLPKASYRAVIRWGNPQAVAVDTLLRLTLDAAHYRAIR